MSDLSPPPLLARRFAPFVESAWQERAGDAARQFRVLPDACCDLIARRGADGEVSLFFVGPALSAYLVDFEPGVQYAGLRLRPGRIGALWPALDGATLASCGALDAAEVFGAQAREWTDRLSTAADLPLLPALERLLLDTSAPDAQPRTWPRALQATDLITATDSHDTLPGIARQVGIAERSLRREITRSVGLSPRDLSRIARFRRAVDRMRAEPYTPLTTIAYDCGYADQAHFSRECRSLAGVAPSELRQEFGG